MATSLVIAFSLFLLRFIAAEAVFQRGKQTVDGYRFPVGIGLRLLFRAGGPFMMFVGCKMLEQARNCFDESMAALVALIGIVCVVGEPGEIIVTKDGLIQQSIFGLRKTSIAWTGAVVSFIPQLREVLIIGSDGTPITHSKYHVGQQQFLYQLERHGLSLKSGL
ncbi:MAG: hypothetical protein K2X03_13180 [Bryobacteraceae bacterium]|nr:hypothetical protein [Bryobacteraceae bacterium]